MERYFMISAKKVKDRTLRELLEDIRFYNQKESFVCSMKYEELTEFDCGRVGNDFKIGSNYEYGGFEYNCADEEQVKEFINIIKNDYTKIIVEIMNIYDYKLGEK